MERHVPLVCTSTLARLRVADATASDRWPSHVDTVGNGLLGHPVSAPGPKCEVPTGPETSDVRGESGHAADISKLTRLALSGDFECPRASRCQGVSGHRSGQPIYEYTTKIARQVPALYDPLQKRGGSSRGP